MKTPPNPYVGPRSFREGERLYGRKRELTNLTNLLLAERIVVLHSPSGAGKSSLLNAGLVPIMKHRGFVVRPVIRINNHPPAGVTINRFTLSTMDFLKLEDRATATTLQEYLDPNPNGELLIFDQFEEVLTTDPVNMDAKIEFFRQLGDVLQAVGRWAVIAIREDYIAGLDPYLRYVPSRLSNTFRLDRLKGLDAMEAIRMPAEDAGVKFSDAAVQQICDDLRVVNVPRIGGGTERTLGELVEPMLLQVVCWDVWDDLPERTRQIGKLPQTKGKSIGAEALEAYYDRAAKNAATAAAIEERDVRVWCGDRLITSAGTRGQVVKGEGLDDRAIDSMIDADLLRAQPRNGVECVELMHDRLIQPVIDSNTSWMDSLTGFQREAELWAKDKRSDRLLSGEALVQAEDQAETMPLSKADRDFIRESRKAERNRLMIQWGSVALAVLLAIAVGMGLWVARSRSELRAALAEYLAQVPTILDNGQPAQALAYLARALRNAPESPKARAWAAALLSRNAPAMPVAEFDHGATIDVLVFSGDGSRLLSSNKAGKSKVWDTRTGRQTGPDLPGSAAADLNRDGTLAALNDPLTLAGSIIEVATGKTIWHDSRVVRFVFSAQPREVFVYRIAAPGSAEVQLLHLDSYTVDSSGVQFSFRDPAFLPLAKTRVLIPLGKGETNGLALWEPFHSHERPRELKLPATIRSRARVSPDAGFVAVVYPGDEENPFDKLEVWDLKASKALGSRSHQRESEFARVFAGFGPSASPAIAWGFDWLQHWNPSDGEPASPRWQLSGRIVFRSGQRVLAEELGEALTVRDIANCSALAQLLAPGPIHRWVNSDDGALIATSVAAGTKAQLWSIPAPAAIEEKRKLPAAPPRNANIRSEDGSRVLIMQDPQTPLVQDARTNAVLATLHTGSAEIVPGNSRLGAISAKGTYATITDPNGRAVLFDVAGNRVVRELLERRTEAAGMEVLAMLFTRDEQLLITAHQNATLWVWDTRTGLPIGNPVILPWPPLQLALSSDGRKVLVETRTGLSQWDVALGSQDETEAEALADLAEAAGGLRLPRGAGAISSLSLDERRKLASNKSSDPAIAAVISRFLRNSKH
ncbi:MAG: hypothetical protein HY820_11625 [Acidobacteria bacterium]|nr:hypothetical protein [Acidobacteriota bacterium]